MRPKKQSTARAIVFLPILIAATLIASLSAQDIQIKSRVELVEVPVTVRASNGTLTIGLTKEAFTIKEGGKIQTITNFSVEPVPISAAVVVDTGISESSLAKVKTSFPALLGAFAEDDELAFYRFEKTVERITDFTSDRSRQRAAVEKINGATASSSTLATGPFSTPGPVINGVPVIPGVQSAGRTTATPTKILHDAMFQAAEDLGTRDIGRRRILILIADGQNKNSLHSYDTALERLLTHNVQVFSVGLDTTVFQRLTSSLGSYAKDSGGTVWYPDSQSGIETCYPLTTDSARNQYVLTYVSSNKRPVAKPVFREIRVQVSTRNSEIRHKRGYYQAP